MLETIVANAASRRRRSTALQSRVTVHGGLPLNSRPAARELRARARELFR